MRQSMICGLFQFYVCCKRQQVWAQHIFWQQYLEAVSPWPGHTLVFNIWDDVRRYGAIICHTHHSAHSAASIANVQPNPVYGIIACWTETRETDEYAWCSDDCWAIDRAMTNDPSHGAVRDAGMQFTLDTECRIQTFDWCINGGLEIETLCLHSVLWR